MRLFPGKWDYSLQVRDFKFVSVGVLVTEFGSWQLLLFVKVRKAGKSVTNILSFSPTYFVSNIGRKHQCSLKVWNLKKVAKIPRYFSFSAIVLCRPSPVLRMTQLKNTNLSSNTFIRGFSFLSKLESHKRVDREWFHY